VPKEANSGVYLRGRYELQIDDAAGLEPSSHHLGGLYGFIERARTWRNIVITPATVAR
jgi:hypothetical protein